MLTIPLRVGPFEKKRGFRNHDEYLARIEKSFYYVRLPKAYCTSLPCTELATEIFSEINKFSIDQLHLEEAANLSRNACVSPCSLVLALLYLDRLKTINPKYLTKVSPSELFLISVMVGSKFLQDDGEEDEVNNYEWAASAGINVQDVNKAEKQFLDAIKWHVFVSEKEFWDRFHELECKVGLRQGCKRGWFTYTELNLLLEFIDIVTIIQTFCTVTTACLTSYTASMLTLLGSALIVSQIPGLGLKTSVQEIQSSNSWNYSTSVNYMTNTFMDQNSPIEQDCYVASYKLGASELDIGHSEEHIQNLCNSNHLPISEKSETDLRSFLKFYFTRSKNALNPLVREITGRNRIDWFHTCGKIWSWTDSITNFIFMNTISNKFLPVMDF